MPQWIAIELLKTCRLDEVVAPGIMFDKDGEPQFLVIGNPAMAIFLDKSHGAEGFLAEGGANFNGVAVEDIEIEVDFESVENTHSRDAPPLAVVREADSIGVTYQGRDSHGFRRTLIAAYDAGPREREPNQPAMFYRNWRAVYRDGTDKIEVFKTES